MFKEGLHLSFEAICLAIWMEERTFWMMYWSIWRIYLLFGWL